MYHSQVVEMRVSGAIYEVPIELYVDLKRYHNDCLALGFPCSDEPEHGHYMIYSLPKYNIELFIQQCIYLIIDKR